MYTYNATLDRVIDGDTVDVLIDLGFDVTIKRRLRLKGVDTPELRDRDQDKRQKALAARSFVETALQGKRLRVQTYKTRSGSDRKTFGRYVADIYFDTNEDEVRPSLSQMIIDAGFANG